MMAADNEPQDIDEGGEGADTDYGYYVMTMGITTGGQPTNTSPLVWLCLSHPCLCLCAVCPLLFLATLSSAFR
jgi:hypothetical protein